jgi:hypothetical protein
VTEPALEHADFTPAGRARIDQARTQLARCAELAAAIASWPGQTAATANAASAAARLAGLLDELDAAVGEARRELERACRPAAVHAAARAAAARRAAWALPEVTVA